MKNYIKPGHTIDLTAPSGGLSSGQAKMFGALFGVATKAALEGEKVAVALEGVFSLPKAAGTSLAEGAAAYWTGAAITATASGNTLVGHATSPAASDATSIEVRIKN
ncbi:MAG: hypothetical protein DI528_12980 [Shinella sp.]|nr:MAG: hypothetical protein DI528_12980 [Shinella sp.]